MKCDFSGWATRNDILCTDGRTIRRNAFKEQDGARVPLVYQHNHDDISNVLGHAVLENRDEGVYAYCFLNNTTQAQDAKELVRHGDLTSFSIYANKLKQNGKDVIHGSIKEVSLVIAGANKGAVIENTYFEHADGSLEEYEGEATIKSYMPIELDTEYVEHADNKEEETKVATETKTDDKDKTIQDVIDSMTDEQKNVMYFMIGEALNSNKAEHSDDSDAITHSDEGGNEMKHNVFENDRPGEYIEHADELRADILSAIAKDSKERKNISSLGDYILEHAENDYGITDIEFLFPDARTLTNTPEFIKRDDDWVSVFMNASKHSPFSRVKSMFADITADEARAKGYTKGNRKIEEVFTLLKRTTSPTTIYKKQKLDRDDIIDVVDFDVVVWLKSEMRMMLNEEIARAALIGDGRNPASDDKIDESCIRPIWTDDPLYTVPVKVYVAAADDDETRAKKIIKEIKKQYRHYKGSGNPSFYLSGEWTTNFLLIEDGIGHDKYDTTADVAKALRVKNLIDVPVMENQSRTVTEGEGASAVTETRILIGLIVNPIDYNFGADKGGAVNMFDDFDIDYNQMKYLMETRCSGALVKPYSAMAVEMIVSNG